MSLYHLFISGFPKWAIPSPGESFGKLGSIISKGAEGREGEGVLKILGSYKILKLTH